MNLPEGVSVCECGTLGLQILNYLDDADYAIIVDAVRSGKKPGTVSMFIIDVARLEELGDVVSMHQIDLLGTLSLGNRIARLPPRVLVVGIEPLSISVGLELSPEVRRSIRPAVRRVLEEVKAATGDTQDSSIQETNSPQAS